MMTRLASLALPGWWRLAAAAAALVAAAAAGCWLGDRLQAMETAKVRTELAHLQARHAEQVAAAEAAARAAVEQSIAQQTALALKVATDAQALIASAQRDRAAVGPAVARLRDAERAYWTRACGGGAATVAATPGSSASGEAAGVHPDLSGRLAAFAAGVGDFAERSHAAAAACNAMTP